MPITLAGFPPITTPSEKFFVTTLPAATTTLGPIVTPGIIIALFSGFLFDVNIPWTEIFHTIARAGFGEWLAFLQFILLSVISITKSVLAIYTAVTVGHQAQNHTTLASIGAYIGVLVFEALAARIFMTPMQNLFTNVDSAAKLNLGLLVLTLLTLALGAVYFFLCKYFMENKLNLD